MKNSCLPIIEQFASFNWNIQYILEESIDLEKEISIGLVRDRYGKVIFFPIAENHHVDGILDTSIVPAKINKLTQEVQQIARKIADALNITGILAVEFFITKNNELLAFNNLKNLSYLKKLNNKKL